MKFIFRDFSRHNYIYKPVINIRKSQDKKTNLLNKLRSFLDTEEPKTIKWLVSLWNKQQEAITYKELRKAYLNGGITKKQLEKWQMDYSKFVVDKFYLQWQKAMEAAANQRLELMQEYIQNHGAELVIQITQEQKKALNAMIQQSIYYDNMTADELSRIMRPCIGLTVPQSKANMNYYNTVKMALIKSGEKEKNAKKKALDKSVKYAAKQHRYRAMNIARTELAKAYNQGGYLAAKDAQAKGYLGKVKKIWVTAADERVCPICGAADEEEADIEKSFSTGIFLPPAHPSCRCAVAYKEIELNEIFEMPNKDSNAKDTIFISTKENSNKLETVEDFEKIITKVSEDNNIPKSIRNIIKQNTQNNYIIIDNNLDIPFRYMLNNGLIAVNPKHDSFKNYNLKKALLHEMGHKIDKEEIFAASNLSFITAIEEQREKIIENIEKYKKIIETDNDLYYNMGISDIFSALTNNKISGAYFHDKKYWEIISNRETEIFADLFSEISFNDKKSINLIKNEFTELYSLFIDIIGGE